jgi:hypothetical protein
MIVNGFVTNLKKIIETKRFELHYTSASQTFKQETVTIFFSSSCDKACLALKDTDPENPALAAMYTRRKDDL